MEGAIVLHETLHYIRKNKMGLFLRLILKKLIIKWDGISYNKL